MVRIVIEPDEVRAGARELERAAGDLEALAGRVERAVSATRWELRSRANIEGAAGDAMRRAHLLVREARELARFMAGKAAALEEADRAGGEEITRMGARFRQQRWEDPNGGPPPLIPEDEMRMLLAGERAKHDALAAVVGTFPWLAKLLGQVEPFDEAKAREEILQHRQAVVDREAYQARANALITGATPEERNRQRTTAYIDLYNQNPQLFKWPGMAFYASKAVGDGLRTATDLAIVTGAPMPSVNPLFDIVAGGAGYVISSRADELYDAFEAGNDAIFRDIYWQHLAYQEKGMAEIELLHSQGQLSDTAYNAWKEIDEGRRLLAGASTIPDGDPECDRIYAEAQDHIWKGTQTMINFEQREVLQPVTYDGHKLVWAVASAKAPAPFGQGESTFWGYHWDHDKGWDKVEPDSLANVEERMDWIENELLPAFRNLEERNWRRMESDMQEYKGGS